MPIPHSESRSTTANMFHLSAAAVKTPNPALAIQRLITPVISVAKSTSFATARTSSLLGRLFENEFETSQIIDPLLGLVSPMLSSSLPTRRSTSTGHCPHPRLTRNPTSSPRPSPPRLKPLIRALIPAMTMKKRPSFCPRNPSVRPYPPPGRLIQAPPHMSDQRELFRELKSIPCRPIRVGGGVIFAREKGTANLMLRMDHQCCFQMFFMFLVLE
jgi:hypothetical protein